MQVSIDIPQSVASQLQAEWADLSQAVKESVLIEAYRAEKLSLGQLSELLGLSIDQADGLLKQRGVHPNYTLDDFERECASLKKALSS